MSLLDAVLDTWNDFWGYDEDETEDSDSPCVSCSSPTGPSGSGRMDLDEWMSFHPGENDISELQVDQEHSAVVVTYSDGQTFRLPAATGNGVEYGGADAIAEGSVRDTFGSLTYDGFANTRIPWSEEDTGNPYGPAYIRLSGPTGSRHIHGTSGPMNTSLDWIGGADPEDRRFTHGCARLPNEAIVKLRDEVEETLARGAKIPVVFTK